MEASEIFSEEWSFLSGFSTAEEAEFMTQFAANCSLPEELHGNASLGFQYSSSALWPIGITSEIFYFPSNVADDADIFASVPMSFEVQVPEAAEEDKSSTMENSGKRSRSSVEIPNEKRNAKPRKNSESCSASNKEEERSSNDLQEQNSSSCSSSEDDSMASQEADRNPKNNTALKSNGKSRSDRCPSTDPQSVYARRRRERINERLRILQNLVPSGTKVDISTMLEEAIQYVKFLQLQIKLLSSDDLWMYAPIAYNGLNIDITPTKQP